MTVVVDHTHPDFRTGKWVDRSWAHDDPGSDQMEVGIWRFDFDYWEGDELTPEEINFLFQATMTRFIGPKYFALPEQTPVLSMLMRKKRA